MPGWNNGTRLTRVLEPEAGCYSWFQNFSFTYGSCHFMCSDFVTQGHALSKRCEPWCTASRQDLAWFRS